MFVPNVGAPPGWTASPCWSMISANPATAPSATSTPGTACTVSTTLSSSGRSCPPVVVTSASYGLSARTTTSVPEVSPV